jgi:hypothetical protein
MTTLLDELQGSWQHVDIPAGHGLALGGRLAPDIDHMGLAGSIEMSQI